MDFTFSTDQDDLRDAVRSFLSRPGADQYRREVLETENGFTEEWWAEISALGWPGLLVPEIHGGLGLGVVDAVVVAEEMGRVAQSGPYLSSAIAATLAAVQFGADDLLVGLAGGAVRGTVAIEENGYGDPLDTVSTVAAESGDGWVLNGVKQVVIDGHTAHFVIVAARTPEGLAAFVVEGAPATPEPCLDLTRKIARLDLQDVPARRIGPAGDQTALLARLVDDIEVALCAETVGASERALNMAIEYAKQRVQFDRPIATFQAIKHKIVDMLHQLELARVGTHWAAWCSQVDDPQRARAAAACKAFVAEAAVMVTSENIQVHGGVGFTWDLDCHLLFRRVKANDVLFGNQSWNRSRLADLILSP
jgi:alkylation response protein AidB-like acyl-CoA dehydrogenase